MSLLNEWKFERYRIFYFVFVGMVYKKKVRESQIKKKSRTTKEMKEKRIQQDTVAKAECYIREKWAEVKYCDKCKNPMRPKWVMPIVGMCTCWRELKYKETYPSNILAWFMAKCDTCRTYFSLEEHYKAVPPQLPTFERWSVEQGVSDKTRKEWAEEFLEFGNACDMCYDLVDAMITELAMAGKYPANYAMFYQKSKLNYEDKKKIEVEWSGFNLLLLAEEADKKEGEKNDIGKENIDTN